MSTGSRDARLRQLGLGVLLVPGALTIYLGFNSGGFFPGATGVAAAVLLVLFALRALLAERPFEGFSPTLAVSGGALALLCVLILLSSYWSEAAARSLLEFDRALLYLFALLVCGSVARRRKRVRLVLGGIGVGIFVVCLAGFLSRTLPDVVPTGPVILTSRLNHPVGYWNGLGLLAAQGIVIATHFCCDHRRAVAVRAAGAAAVPVLAVTLLLTFSRGAIAAAVLGLVVYVSLSRGRGLVLGLPVVLAVAAPVLVVGYEAELLASAHPSSPAATKQGHELALWTAACTVAGGLLVLGAVRFEPRLPRLPSAAGARRRVRAVVGVGVALLVLATTVALDLPAAAGDRYDQFVKGDEVAAARPVRERLTEVGSKGRLANWRVARGAFAEERLAGYGAGTYQVLWTQRRASPAQAVDAHSLYLETLAELGIVGLVLVLIAFGAILARCVVSCRGPGRTPWAVITALVALWLVHAGIDWDWEQPGVSLPVFFLAGVTLARRAGSTAGRRERSGPPPLLRLVVALGCLVLSVTPLSVAYSQAKLNESVRAFRAGDCGISIDASLASAKALGSRPEPFQMLSLCDVKLGLDQLALRMAQHATKLDPDNWEFRYTLAIVQGATGRDPRPAARAAMRLNPRSPLAKKTARLLSTPHRETRERRAIGAPLPFQQ